MSKVQLRLAAACVAAAIVWMALAAVRIDGTSAVVGMAMLVYMVILFVVTMTRD